MAHKKAAGSAKNLRDSNPKYRGLKLAGGQFARAGNIIIRQKGDKYQLGKNVYKGSDFTVHASIDGVVLFTKKRVQRYDGRKYLKTVVNVVPQEKKVAKKTSSSSTKKASPASSTNSPAKKTKTVPKDAKKPKDTKQSKDTLVDDLTKIEGIGPKIQEVFYKAGIKTFADLSSSKVGDLRTLLAENKLSQHNPKTRKKQATLAKNEKWDELKALQDELNGGK